jgi:dUTP pyrophosphatase
MEKVRVKIKLEEGVNIPSYETKGASGFDLRAKLNDDVLIKPGEVCLVPTGIRVEIPEGYELQIRPRSGLALKEGISVLNTPGTIDSDYRGEIKVILYNVGKKEVVIRNGERIAQAVLNKVYRAEFYEDSLNESERGEGGFGSTGK